MRLRAYACVRVCVSVLRAILPAYGRVVRGACVLARPVRFGALPLTASRGASRTAWHVIIKR